MTLDLDAMLAAARERCPDCDRPLATGADLRSDGAQCPEDALLCWRAENPYAPCEPVDWRARALTAEAERDTALAASYEHGKVLGEAVAKERLLRAEVRGLSLKLDEVCQDHADAQSMLEEVAAERDRAQEAVIMGLEAGKEALCMLAEWGRECRARDRSLDACAERIRELLADRDHWQQLHVEQGQHHDDALKTIAYLRCLLARTRRARIADADALERAAPTATPEQLIQFAQGMRAVVGRGLAERGHTEEA